MENEHLVGPQRELGPPQQRCHRRYHPANRSLNRQCPGIFAPNLCVCVCVCVYVCVCVCMCVYMCVCLCIVHVHTYIQYLSK
jgi:hypothetical protein